MMGVLQAMGTAGVGNRAGLPWYGKYGYLPADHQPTKLRIYHIGPTLGDDAPWQMDECGVVDGCFAVSEWADNFETFEQALEAARTILREGRP